MSLTALPLSTRAEPPARTAASAPQMPGVIRRYAADRRSLLAVYRVSISPARFDRMRRFYEEQKTALAAIDFEALSPDDRINYVLLRNKLGSELHQLAIRQHQSEEIAPRLPFASALENLLDQHRRMQRPGAEGTAKALTAVVREIEAAGKQWAPEDAFRDRPDQAQAAG